MGLTAKSGISTRTRQRLAALLVALVSFGCGGEGEDTDPPIKDEPPPPTIPNESPVHPPSHADCPNGTSWTYENLGEGFMLTYCTACHNAALTGEDRHGAPEGVDFDTPGAVQLWRANIIARIETQTMPPSAHVPTYERTAMIQWLKCGAPAGEDRIQ